MPGPGILVDIVKAGIFIGAYAQLLGMPIAWARLRKTAAWRERPDGIRRIDLLADFMIGATVLSIAWGALVVLVDAIGLGLSTGALLVIFLGGPTIFVPWLVLQLDPGRLAAIVEEKQRRKLARG
jgi:hypothetical protein